MCETKRSDYNIVSVHYLINTFSHVPVHYHNIIGCYVLLIDLGTIWIAAFFLHHLLVSQVHRTHSTIYDLFLLLYKHHTIHNGHLNLDLVLDLLFAEIKGKKN